MIVDQATVEMITGGKIRKLFLPFKRGEQGELLPCPVVEEEVFNLWCGVPFRKGVKATVVSAGRALAGEAKGAVQPEGHPGDEGWLIVFVLGDHSAFFDRHAPRFLSKSGVTTDPLRAIRSEPQLTSEEESKLAVRARVRRELEEEQRWRAAREQTRAALEALRACGGGREFVGDVAFLERRLAKMDRRRLEKRAVGTEAA